MSILFNQDKLYIIKRFINYFIRESKEIKNINNLLHDFELLIHNNKSSIQHILIFFINIMKNYYNTI